MKAKLTATLKLNKGEVNRAKKQAIRMIENLGNLGVELPAKSEVMIDRIDREFAPVKDGMDAKFQMDIDYGDYYVTAMKTVNEVLEQPNLPEVVEAVKPLVPSLVALVKSTINILEAAGEKIVEDMDITGEAKVNGEVQKFDFLEADNVSEVANG